MAATTLPIPGTEFGPCALAEDGQPSCYHPDCWHIIGMAGQPCIHCGDPIGYDTRFYDETVFHPETRVGVQRLAHAICVERQRSV